MLWGFNMAYEISGCHPQKFRRVIGIFERGRWYEVHDPDYMAHFTASRIEIFFDHKCTIYLRAERNTLGIEHFARSLEKVAGGNLHVIDDKVLSTQV